MPNGVATGATQAATAQPAATPALAPEQLLEQIAELLAQPPRVAGIEFQTDYFAQIKADDGKLPTLLPDDHAWQRNGSQVPHVPLQLCEFLAYKTALAYENASRIEAFTKAQLKQCGVRDEDIDVRVFDSARNPSNRVGVLADAQGFGFIFERKAFVIFRGTTSSNDWKINRTDTLTSDLGLDGDSTSDRRAIALRATYGPLLGKLGNPKPGRHVGFSIAWAALKDEVEDWLADALERGAIDKIIYAGHSLGGAMAQVAAFDHARIEKGFERDRGIAPSRVGAVVTFGAPAVGGPEFVAAYKALLGDRTVLLESSGDLVPRIMNRWYYRMLYPLRQRVKAGVQAHLVSSQGFGKVASPWTFASEPPLSDGDIDAAMQSIREAAAKAAREIAAEQKRKEAQRSAPASGNGPARSANGTSGGTSASKAAEPAPGWVYWVVGGVVVLAVGGLTWYFVRRKLFSHDIQQRYALYLSTLSYQQLRAKHGGNLDLANAELAEHLKFVRGDVASCIAVAKAIPDETGSHTPLFAEVHALPLPLKVRNDPLFVEFLKKTDTFV